MHDLRSFDWFVALAPVAAGAVLSQRFVEPSGLNALMIGVALGFVGVLSWALYQAGRVAVAKHTGGGE